MASDKPASEQLQRFAARFNHLRTALAPAGQRRPLSARQVSEGVREATGVEIAESTIASYIRGEKVPGLDKAAALAAFLGVSTSYFTDEDVSAVDADLERFGFLRQLREASVTTVAGRLGGLSTPDLHALKGLIGVELGRRDDSDRGAA
jgi:transcriptional regulator with XRE-family HTH domain